MYHQWYVHIKGEINHDAICKAVILVYHVDPLAAWWVNTGAADSCTFSGGDHAIINGLFSYEMVSF